MSDKIYCQFCDKELSKEKGEYDHGCIDCHYDPRVEKILFFKRELKKLKQQNEKLRECVEFYADRDNWTPSDDEFAWKVEDKITRNDLYKYVPDGLRAEFECGGKLARKCLEEIGE